MVASMLSLNTCNYDMATAISSIQFKFYIEVIIYHIRLYNEDWNIKVYVPRAPCSHPMSTVAESSMTGGTVKRTAAHIIRQDIKGIVYDTQA